MLYVFKSNTGGGERRPHIEELFLLAAADLGAAPRVVERRALRALLLRQRFQHLAADVLQLILFVIGAVYRVQVLHRLRLLLPAHAVDDLDASGATSSSSISSTGLSSYYSLAVVEAAAVSPAAAGSATTSAAALLVGTAATTTAASLVGTATTTASAASLAALRSPSVAASPWSRSAPCPRDRRRCRAAASSSARV